MESIRILRDKALAFCLQKKVRNIKATGQMIKKRVSVYFSTQLGIIIMVSLLMIKEKELVGTIQNKTRMRYMKATGLKMKRMEMDT